MHILIVILVITLSLGACVSNPPRTTVSDYSCDFLPPQPQPGWLTHPQQTGFYVGIGSAERAQSPKQQQQLATTAARGNLALSIETHISTSMRIDQRVQRSGGTEQVEQDIRQITQSTTELALERVETAQMWLDPNHCTLWVKVRITEADVEQQQEAALHRTMFNHMVSLDTDSSTTSLPPGERLDRITRALELLGQLDYRHLQGENSADYYQQRLQGRQQQIYSQLQAREVLLIALIPSQSTSAISKPLLEHLHNGRANMHIIHTPACDSATSCRSWARQQGARRLLLVDIEEQSKSGMMGGIEGNLNVNVTEYDAASGRVLTAPIQANARILAFDERDLNWGNALAKLLTPNPFKALR